MEKRNYEWKTVNPTGSNTTRSQIIFCEIAYHVYHVKNAKIIFQEEKKNKVYQKYGKSEAFQTGDSQGLFHLEALVKLETGQSIELRTQQFLSGALSSPFFRNLTPSSGETEYSETPPLIFGLWMDFLKLGSTGT
ncbi:hypothetical protein RhiirB3_395737 [Rhizophagus irregularis]|nr:hypothetical protein RhiirB3_395737 [Rhizophagus irregularis]